MSVTVRGHHSWSMEIDDIGRRIYKLYTQVQSTDLADGPYTVYGASGIPRPGNIWSYQNDDDIWAFCTYNSRIWSMQSNVADPTYWWLVENTFSSLPQTTRCGSTLNSPGYSTGNPIYEPQKIDYAFTKLVKEAVYDKNNKLITNSAFEPIKGNTVEFDYNRLGVTIEQWSYDEPISTFTNYIDTVNDSTLWGYPARCIKLSNVSGPRYVLGSGLLTPYWVTKLEFEAESPSQLTSDELDAGIGSWDKIIPDYGTRVLNGKWNQDTGEWILVRFPGYTALYPTRPNPDPLNPAHYRALPDRVGNQMKGPLNGAGLPAFNPIGAGSTDPVGELYIQYYPSVNFALLGIPTDLSNPCQ